MLSRLLVMVLVGLVAGAAPAAPIAKVAVLALQPHGADAAALAATLTSDLAAGLNQVVGLSASVVRPQASGSPPRRTAAATARAVVAATGADVVLQGGLVRVDQPAGYLVSLVGYLAASDEIVFLPALRSAWTEDPPDPLAGWLDGVAPPTQAEELASGLVQHVRAAIEEWSLPVGQVVTVEALPGLPSLLAVWLDGPLPPAADRLRLQQLPAARLDSSSGERLAAPGRDLGWVEPARAEQGLLWLRGRPGLPVAAGDRIRLLPADQPPSPLSDTSGVAVTSLPAGAEVWADGQLIGLSPLWLPLPEGASPKLALRHAGSLPWQVALDGEARRLGLVSAQLTPSQPAGPTSESMIAFRLVSEPSGAEVVVDGVVRGVTPLAGQVAAGWRNLLVRKQGYRPWTAQFLLTEPTTLRAELRPETGVLRVITEPPGAQVQIDGVDRGRSPVTVDDLLFGPHQVRLVHPARGVTHRTVVVAPGEAAELRVQLEAPTMTAGSGASGLDLPPVPRLPLSRAPLVVGERLFTTEVAVSPIDGGEAARLLLRLERLPAGGLLTVRLDPPRPFTVDGDTGRLTVTFGGLRAEAARFDALALAELSALRVGATESGLQLDLELAEGVVAKVHDYTTLEQVLLVIYHPAANQAR